MGQQKFKRHYFKNFLIKKDLQLRFIRKIIFAVIITAVITVAILGAVYYVKANSGYFYFIEQDLMGDLEQRSMLEVILPSLVIAEIVSIIVGVMLGLFSSRKFAVPIYKIEQFVTNLQNHKFGARLFFREKDEFEDLTRECNTLSEGLKETFDQLSSNLDAAGQCATLEEMKAKVEETRNLLREKTESHEG